MIENNQDALARAFATLSSLRKNIDDMQERLIPLTYVREFHAVLDRVAGIGIDVSEFRIPESELKAGMRVASYKIGDPSSFKSNDSGKEYVERSFILFKIDSILSYFEIITSEKPRKIGFTKPEK